MGEQFGQKEIENCMRAGWAGRPVSFYAEIDSTNLKAKQEAEAGAGQGSLIVADMQTAGRGRSGRQWSSPAGSNLYFSLILKPDFGPELAPMITLVMGVAVAEAIRRLCGLEAFIKWPNDIVVEGKKVCGILTEMSLAGTSIAHVVIGTGINVGIQEFPTELQNTATSLEAQCAKAVSRCELLALIMKYFEAHYESFLKHGSLKGLLNCYNSLLINKDREVRVLDPKGEYSGIARGINETGELLVELADGKVVEVYAGEVSVRGLYGYV